VSKGQERHILGNRNGFAGQPSADGVHRLRHQVSVPDERQIARLHVTALAALSGEKLRLLRIQVEEVDGVVL
jgi:hypothetical protein